LWPIASFAAVAQGRSLSEQSGPPTVYEYAA
jgi:hypothetical protein